MMSTMINFFFSGFRFEVREVFVTFLVLFILIRLVKHIRKWNQMPPGPWGFPIVGHLPILGEYPHKTFDNMRRRYGDIFMIRMGSWPTVILNNHELICEAFVKKNDFFADRPGYYSCKNITNQKSLPFGKFDARWKMHRKIANNVLRTFANTKNDAVEELIQTEALSLSRDLISNQLNLHEYICMTAGSIIYQLCYGKNEHCKNDKDYKSLFLQNKTFGEFTGAGNPIDVMPWLQYLMPWKARKFIELVKDAEIFRRKKVEEHIKTFNADFLRDATDGFILAAHELEQTKNGFGLTKDQLYSSLESFIGAGFDTVATTTEWFLLYMAVFPKIQHRVQDEIDLVIGNKRPSIQYRDKMPYTQAMILEVFRMCTVVPLALPHAATKDVVLNNYLIPKGTVVFANIYAVSRESSVWEEPEKFKPERFLTKNSEINSTAADYTLYFGAGRRRCLGEFLAKVEIFIIFTTLLQQCNFDLAPGVKYDFEGEMGLTLRPKPYKLKVSRRSS